MKKRIFVTGTDTGVGKTISSALLLSEARSKGLRTIGFKPVASGCCETAMGLRNTDAVVLHRLMTMDLSYEQINPLCVLEPVAPHIGLKEQGIDLNASQIAQMCMQHIPNEAEFVLMEGAGGWRVPLCGGDYFSDLAVSFATDVVLVVGVRLGCINHAILTAEAIRGQGLNVAGWIANHIEPDMLQPEESIAAIERAVGMPPAMVLPIIPNRRQYESANIDIDVVVSEELELVTSLSPNAAGVLELLF